MSQTDLIIGMASGYEWADLEPFAVSLQRSGFKGECVLITGEGPKDEVPRYGPLPKAREDRSLEQMLGKYGIKVLDVDKFDEHPSIMRGRFVAEVIAKYENQLNYVICVDTKDVVFQKDPTQWMRDREGAADIYVVSEMQNYGSGDLSVGNNKNMIDAFGIAELNRLKGKEIVNGGIIGGKAEYIKALEFGIYGISLEDRRRKEDFKPSYKDMLPDQSALNILIREDFFKSKTYITRPQDGFAFGHPLTRYSTFHDDDSMMYPAGQQTPYAIFHQYFDKPEWWRAVRSKWRA